MTAGPIPIVAVGECMIELREEAGAWRVGHSGDSFNTALYLSRLGETVGYLTVLGDDPFSASMRAAWADEGIDLDLVLTAPRELPGLYAIKTDDAGERSFHYWRGHAAVRRLFALPGARAALDRAGDAELLYVTGITLALFGEAHRGELAGIAKAVRARGGQVAFDPNYRAGLWPSASAAEEAVAAFAPLVTIALPTFEDEALLHGDRDPARTVARWHAAGAAEVVVKCGAAGCVLDDRRAVAPERALVPLDTTGAGDAFNAAYLATRRRGGDRLDAATRANRLAGRVIGSRGAIAPRAAMADLMPGDEADKRDANGRGR